MEGGMDYCNAANAETGHCLRPVKSEGLCRHHLTGKKVAATLRARRERAEEEKDLRRTEKDMRVVRALSELGEFGLRAWRAYGPNGWPTGMIIVDPDDLLALLRKER
jgi:hypothetical protein